MFLQRLVPYLSLSFKRRSYFVIVVSSMVFLYGFLPGCATEPYVCHETVVGNQQKQEIFFVNHGWHTGLIVPAEDITTRLPQLKERFTTSLFLEFGWGDKTFYQADEITAGMAVGALFWPTESVMHVVAVHSSPELYFAGSEIQSICLSAIQYGSLICFLEQSFFHNDGGKIVAQQRGIYGDSQFYKGIGSYSLFNTCNNWSAKALESAGVDIPFYSILTAGGVMQYVHATAQSQTGQDCLQEKIQEDDISLSRRR